MTTTTAPHAGERELLPTATPAQTRAAVRELARPHRPAALGGFAVLTVSTGVGLLTAPILGHIIDLVAGGRPADAITVPVAWLAAIAVVQGVTAAVGVSLIARLGEGMLATLRERFVERALRLPLERVERAGSGDLTSRVTNDVSVITNAVRDAMPALARSLLTIALTLVGLAILDWRFLLVALVAVPIQAHTVRWYARRAVPLYTAQRVAVGAQQQQLLDTVGGASTVRAFRLADEHVHLVGTRSRAAVDLALRGVRLVTRFYSRLNLAEFAGLSAVLVTGFLLVRGGDASVGVAGAAALYFHSLFTPINIALGLADDAQAAVSGLARLVGVAGAAAPPLPAPPAALPPAPASTPVPAPALPTAPAVRVRGVEYAYRPGHPVLHSVDLDIAPGERVALVGTSGAGKTTLARIVAGVHRPAAGSVTVDGVEVCGPDPATTGRSVALVTQEVHVFSGPLADDLRLARPEADDDELRSALELVGALEWARALPEGLDTVVGENGHRLTPAQAQQLALARLVLADPPVAVLDEATAEAGSAGARLLEASAAAAVAGRTALVVAHRLTQAAAADRVVVLDGGRVAEIGTHAELIRAGGGYAALWEAWSDDREPRPGGPVGLPRQG
ncbi:ATP-binding cassette subfamily C protein [Streptosporangium becharense]|uniref:ATP-binding cassette subfamily C protein n=1 Tax=Streptosporangium becharense TaxID=1816182 RepID=A0A7W9IGM2_9ACTN|nr:ABC transporter ATP-binding protein [Streptosporangium becharense]MBB2912759.1 ATP-binding cassette subfamily C protein [Streptosporangium becharense]MBB5820412.1 ATP-binding cassette subfamily C protein [Streptosporangium becharense]